MADRDLVGPSARAGLEWPGFGECVGFGLGSYRTLGQSLGAFLLLAAPWIVLYAAAANFHPELPAIKGLVLALSMIGGSAVAVGVHRVLLRGESPLEALRPRVVILQFLCLIGIALVLAFFTGLVVQVALDLVLPQPVTGSAAEVTLPFLLLVFIARTLLAYPALAIGDPQMTFRRALGRQRLGASRHGSILAGMLVAGFPAPLLDDLLPLDQGTLVFNVLMSALDGLLLLAMSALIASYSSALYRRTAAQSAG